MNNVSNAAFRSQLGHFFWWKTHRFSFFCLCCFFVRFWVVLGRHFGSFWGAKIDPRRAKLGSRRLLKRYVLKKVIFHEKLQKPANNQQQWPQEQSRNGPRSSQNGARTILKTCFVRIVFTSCFSMKPDCVARDGALALATVNTENENWIFWKPSHKIKNRRNGHQLQRVGRAGTWLTVLCSFFVLHTPSYNDNTLFKK